MCMYNMTLKERFGGGGRKRKEGTKWTVYMIWVDRWIWLIEAVHFTYACLQEILQWKGVEMMMTMKMVGGEEWNLGSRKRTKLNSEAKRGGIIIN